MEPTGLLPPHYYPFSVPLIMQITLSIQFKECSQRTLRWLDPHSSTKRGLHAEICSVTQSFKPDKIMSTNKMSADPKPGTSKEGPKTKEIFMTESEDGMFLELLCANDSPKVNNIGTVGAWTSDITMQEGTGSKEGNGVKGIHITKTILENPEDEGRALGRHDGAKFDNFGINTNL
jgi:hypothetical protein